MAFTPQLVLHVVGHHADVKGARRRHAAADQSVVAALRRAPGLWWPRRAFSRQHDAYHETKHCHASVAGAAADPWLRLLNELIRAGKTQPGVSRIKRLELSCHDLQGNRREAKQLEQVTVVLADREERQRVLLPRPLGSCYAVRLTIKELFGPPTNHGTIAEASFIQ